MSYNKISSLLCVGLFAAPVMGCATSHAVHTLGSIQVDTFRRGYTNAHLVRHNGVAILIDAGLEKNAPALDSDLRGVGFGPKTLRAILLTHGHADHAGGAGYFQKRYGTRVIAGVGDKGMLADGHNDTLCPTSDSARSDLPEHQHATFESTKADVWIDAPTALASYAGMEGRIVPLGGHTTGSLVITIGSFAFVGDLFRGSVIGASAERHYYMCDLAGNDLDIRRLLNASALEATTFFAGHFGPITRDDVKKRFHGSTAGGM